MVHQLLTPLFPLLSLTVLHFLANYEMENAKRELNLLQKEIGQIKKAKGDATELLAKKADMDKKIAEMTTRVADLIKKRDQKAGQIGNIVDPQNHVSLSEASFAERLVRKRNVQLIEMVGRQPCSSFMAP